MNLGDIYLKAFVCITAISFVIATAIAFGFRFWRRVRLTWIAASAVFFGILLAYLGNSLFHQKLFAEWHRIQNSVVPQTGCVTYEPSFGRLYAAYEMDRAEFEQWVASHPWRLLPGEPSLEWHDAERLGFEQPEIRYATEMAPNGKQLRVYFKAGTMYLSYNAM